MMGGIHEESYKKIEKVAKGAVATRDKYKAVAKEQAETIHKKDVEIAKLKSNGKRMSENNVDLRNENQALKKELSKMDKFLEKFKLMEKFKAFTKLLEKAVDVVRSGEKEREH
jgi:regulator of replication initiation timing